MPILGALLSIAVIVGAVLLIARLRILMRYLEADRSLRRLVLMPEVQSVQKRRMAVVTSLHSGRRRFRPFRCAAVAGAALVGVLCTCAAFVLAGHPEAPAAGQPAPATVIRTVEVPTTVTNRRPEVTITRIPDSSITVITKTATAPVLPTSDTASVTAVAETRSDSPAPRSESHTATVETAPSNSASPTLPSPSVPTAADIP